MALLDRKKHAIDVLEHVLGGVHATSDEMSDTTSDDVGKLGPRSWVGAGSPQNAVRTTPADETPHSRRGVEPLRPDPYESDRRGEHKYPDTDSENASRPSQREHEELKHRLERRD